MPLNVGAIEGAIIIDTKSLDRAERNLKDFDKDSRKAFRNAERYADDYADGITKDMRQADRALGQAEKGTKDLEKAQKSATKSTSAFSSAAKVAKGVLASFIAVQTVRTVWDFAMAASDMNETVSKSNTIFKDSANEILAWSDDSATAFGLSQQAALESAATIGNMFDQLGAGTDIAAQNSKAMVELAADIASFHNVTGGAEAVLTAMMSSFRGEHDALQRYIPTIKAASVQQLALAETGKTAAGELTELEKATAAISLITRDAGVAVGDFERTSKGAANQIRILEAQWADLKATMGEVFLPGITAALIGINEALDTGITRMMGWVKWIKDADDALNKFLDNIPGLREIREINTELGEEFHKVGEAAEKAGRSVKKEFVEPVISGIEDLTRETDRYLKDLEQESRHSFKMVGTYYSRETVDAIEMQNRMLEADFQKTWDDNEQAAQDAADQIVEDYAEMVNTMAAQTNFFEDAWEQAAKNSASVWSDFFFDAITGDLDSIEDVFVSFGESILRTWTNILGEMVAKWIASGLIDIFGTIFGGGGGLFDFIPFFQDGSSGITKSGVGFLHEGETIVPAESSGPFSQRYISPGYQAGAPRDYVGGADFPGGVGLPGPSYGPGMTPSGHFVQDVVTTINQMADLYNEWNQVGIPHGTVPSNIARIGGLFGFGFPGVGKAVGIIAANIADYVGDAFNTREYEDIKDILEAVGIDREVVSDIARDLDDLGFGRGGGYRGEFGEFGGGEGGFQGTGNDPGDYGEGFSYAGGLEYVPKDMYAKVHRGETITPAHKTGRAGATQIVVQIGNEQFTNRVIDITDKRRFKLHQRNMLNRRFPKRSATG